MKSLKVSFLACAMIIAAFTAHAQGKTGVGDVLPGKIASSAFSLDKTENVIIKGQGGAYHYDDQMVVYYGWIINADTRKVVWHAADNVDKPRFDYGDFDIDASVMLGKGTYEVYYTAAFHNPWDDDWSLDGVGNLFDQVFGDRNKEKLKTEIQERMGIEVSSPGLTKLSNNSIMEQKLASAVVSIVKSHDNDNVKKYFSLNAPTSLKIYAIGEGGKDETFDYAWIYNVDTHKRVWVMDYANTDFAGGAEKNIVANETITLPAGNYMVSYSTDESHSYNDWNALPPHDPQFSGITIWAGSDKDKNNIVAYRAPEESQPVLELTHIGDDEYVSKGLKLGAAMELRVLCIGEGSDDGMVDYGWIMNAATRQVVWDMKKVWKQHAGGASKNKMVDDVIRLEKGDYVVYYATDDSHSYRDWNAGPPHEQDAYGITLWATNKADRLKASLFEPKEYKNDKVVVEILRVRDDERLNEAFTLDKDTNLRILAVGEGSDGEMFDYGWIENVETKKVVWEMTYRNTDAAGGASKNRLFNDTIILPKGSYRVYYETDGSHSYRNWNASPPRDPESYGISLMKEIN